jgi:hypothetical protein
MLSDQMSADLRDGPDVFQNAARRATSIGSAASILGTDGNSRGAGQSRSARSDEKSAEQASMTA